MQLQLSDYHENINVIICEIIAPLFKDTRAILTRIAELIQGSRHSETDDRNLLMLISELRLREMITI